MSDWKVKEDRMLDSAPFKKFIKEFKKSDIVFEENTHGNEMYVVHSGKVKLTTKAPGNEVALAELGPGDFFGEMALCDSAPRSATATVAVDNTRLVVLDREKFLYLVSQQPVFALTIMHALCQRVRERWNLFDEVLKDTYE
jgi:CRP/FNR family cyclic AMP-dependent transcriptional regulator